MVSGSSGDGADIIRCRTGKISSCHFETGLFWNGSAHGILNMGIDALYLGGYIPLLGDCGNLPLNCSFEEQFAHWTVDIQTQYDSWLPTMSEHHSGSYSAVAESTFPATGTADLLSSPITINPAGVEYRFSFYGKTSIDIPNLEVIGRILWYDNSTYLSSTTIGRVDDSADWTLFTTSFECPPPGVNRARVVFVIVDDNFTETAELLLEDTGQIFIDDVKVESRSIANCPSLNLEGD